MKIISGNIWDSSLDTIIVIPTNIGWNRRGNAIMGVGLAKQAADKYSVLTISYGRFCRSLGHLPEYDYFPDSGKLLLYKEYDYKHKLLLFPTKTLSTNPSLSWKQKSDIDLIENGFLAIKGWYKKDKGFKEKISFPMVGCGAGELNEEQVMPLFEKYFGNNDMITIYKYNGGK